MALAQWLVVAMMVLSILVGLALAAALVVGARKRGQEDADKDARA